MSSRLGWISPLAAGLLVAGCGNGTGPAGASLTVTNNTASATLTLDGRVSPTVVIPAGRSTCARFAATTDTIQFTITIDTGGAAPVAEGFSWVTATDPHLTIIAADLTGSVALAEGPGGSC